MRLFISPYGINCVKSKRILRITANGEQKLKIKTVYARNTICVAVRKNIVKAA